MKNRTKANRDRLIILVVATFFGITCNDNGADNTEYDWTLDPCGFADPEAAFIDVSMRSDIFHGDIFSRVEAEVRQGPVPSFHQVVMEEGPCRYLKAVTGSCDPACGGGEVCTPDDECVAYPETISGGKLTVTGLDGKVSIQPEDWSVGTYMTPSGLPVPLFADGDEIGASLAGADFPAVALGALGVAPMDTTLTDDGFEMLDGQDAEITWTQGPNPDACVQVMINGFNAVHGAPLSDIIICEGTDTGSLVIPRSFVEEFPNGETPEVTEGYDWPHSQLTRYTTNSVETEFGAARLQVRSTTYFQPSHPQ